MSLWDEGNYVGDLESGVFGKNEKGTQQVVLTFDIEGNKKRVYGYLSDAAREYTFETLEQLGWNGSMSSPEFANNKKVELYMKHGDPYEGKVQEKWMVSNGGGKVAPLAADEARRIEALWKSSRGGNKAPARPTPGGRPAPARPASTAPARPSAAPAKPADDFGKDQAWDAFEKDGKDNNTFWAAVGAVEKQKGKVEADFTADDWKEVVVAKDIPF